MRKGMAVMLSAALAGCLWGCNGEGENAEEVSLYAQGMDVIRLMQEMSQSEEYAGFISGSRRSVSAQRHERGRESCGGKCLYGRKNLSKQRGFRRRHLSVYL